MGGWPWEGAPQNPHDACYRCCVRSWQVHLVCMRTCRLAGQCACLVNGYIAGERHLSVCRPCYCPTVLALSVRVNFAAAVLLVLTAEPAAQWKAFRSWCRLLHHSAASCLNPAVPLISVPGLHEYIQRPWEFVLLIRCMPMGYGRTEPKA